jgi:phosphatidylserine decarboxylase
VRANQTRAGTRVVRDYVSRIRLQGFFLCAAAINQFALVNGAWSDLFFQPVAPPKTTKQPPTIMVKKLHNWIETDVRPYQEKSVAWLSQYHFFRDPIRPTYSDPSYFFSPADGVILYQREVSPDECIVEIKGKAYSLQQALRDPHYQAPSLVIGIFMTYFDVHVNRIPYPGRLSYREEDPIDTYNHPMLDVEKYFLQDLRIPSTDSLEYLHHNQRMINRIYSADLGQSYYLLQIADYDVDCVTPFCLKQNQPVVQGARFSQVRYGSQVDLIVPLSDRFDFATLQEVGDHIEAGIDPIIQVTEKPKREEP